jgi:hypothetical protein
MMYVRYPLSLRNVEDLLHERGIDVSHETFRFWWNRFGPMFAAEIRKKRIQQLRAHSNWQWHLDEVFVKINGETHYLWRAVDHEGEVLEQTDGRPKGIFDPSRTLWMSASPRCSTGSGVRMQGLPSDATIIPVPCVPGPR